MVEDVYSATAKTRVSAMIVCAVCGRSPPPDFPLGVESEVFIRREDAEWFIQGVCGEPERPSICAVPFESNTVRVVMRSQRRSYVQR